MSDVSVVNIPHDQVIEVWPLIEHFIAGICRDNPISFDAGDLLQRCAKGTLALWVFWDIPARKPLGVMGTETNIGQNSEMYVNAIFLTGEQMERWRDEMTTTVEAWAKAIGARRIIGWARDGWGRALASQGYRRTHVMLEKELV